MSLTATEQQDIAFYLGWPSKVLVSGSQDYNSTFVNHVSNLPAEAETRVRATLTRLREMDKRLDGAADRAVTLQIDDIKQNPEEIRMLRKERMRITRELSDVLDIRVMKSVGSSCNVGVVV